MAETIIQTPGEQKIVRVVNQYHFESDNALRQRRYRDRRNRDAYDNLQDWSHNAWDRDWETTRTIFCSPGV